jgi:hypothetical protein
MRDRESHAREAYRAAQRRYMHASRLQAREKVAVLAARLHRAKVARGMADDDFDGLRGRLIIWSFLGQGAAASLRTRSGLVVQQQSGPQVLLQHPAPIRSNLQGQPTAAIAATAVMDCARSPSSISPTSRARCFAGHPGRNEVLVGRHADTVHRPQLSRPRGLPTLFSAPRFRAPQRLTAATPQPSWPDRRPVPGDSPPPQRPLEFRVTGHVNDTQHMRIRSRFARVVRERA